MPATSGRLHREGLARCLADEEKNITPEQQIKRLEAQIAALVKAAKQVLSHIDDDGAAERHDLGVLALRTAVANAENS
jgi:N-methylhydantoinase B/oxoprolinase/acetone carboxylase alpha subunit